MIKQQQNNIKPPELDYRYGRDSKSLQHNSQSKMLLVCKVEQN